MLRSFRKEREHYQWERIPQEGGLGGWEDQDRVAHREGCSWWGEPCEQRPGGQVASSVCGDNAELSKTEGMCWEKQELAGSTWRRHLEELQERLWVQIYHKRLGESLKVYEQRMRAESGAWEAGPGSATSVSHRAHPELGPGLVDEEPDRGAYEEDKGQGPSWECKEALIHSQ